MTDSGFWRLSCRVSRRVSCWNIFSGEGLTSKEQTELIRQKRRRSLRESPAAPTPHYPALDSRPLPALRDNDQPFEYDDQGYEHVDRRFEQTIPWLPHVDQITSKRGHSFPRPSSLPPSLSPPMAPSRTKKESASPTPPSDDAAPKDQSENSKIKRKSVSLPPTFHRSFQSLARRAARRVSLSNPPPYPFLLRHHFFLSPAAFPVCGRDFHVHAFHSLCRTES